MGKAGKTTEFDEDKKVKVKKKKLNEGA